MLVLISEGGSTPKDVQDAKKRGPYKRAYIAALRQAKFYPPRQAAAAVDLKSIFHQQIQITNIFFASMGD